MKKLLIISLFFLIFSLVSSSAFALLVTDNTDSDNFLYQQGFDFSTSDLTVSKTQVAIPINSTLTGLSEYTLLRDGKLVGISVATSAACTVGGATFDVTINGNVTGVQAWIQKTTVSAVGNSGSAGAQYSYIRQYRNETAAPKGFGIGGAKHNADNPYGKATPLVAGDRIGVKLTTNSTFAPDNMDAVVVVYILE